MKVDEGSVVGILCVSRDITRQRDAQDAQSLMKQGDTALNDLKAGGRGGARVFNTSMMAVLQRTTSQLERARRIVAKTIFRRIISPSCICWTTAWKALRRCCAGIRRNAMALSRHTL